STRGGALPRTDVPSRAALGASAWTSSSPPPCSATRGTSAGPRADFVPPRTWSGSSSGNSSGGAFFRACRGTFDDWEAWLGRLRSGLERRSGPVLAELAEKSVLLLQGPAGPFFRRVARRLARLGCSVTKVNFNAGEDLYFRGPEVVRYTGSLEG